MTLLMTILSVIAACAFLTVITVGLLFIRKPLEEARTSLQRIATGVRALEKQTEPAHEGVAHVSSSLKETTRALEQWASRLRGRDRRTLADS